MNFFLDHKNINGMRWTIVAHKITSKKVNQDISSIIIVLRSWGKFNLHEFPSSEDKFAD